MTTALENRLLSLLKTAVPPIELAQSRTICRDSDHYIVPLKQAISLSWQTAGRRTYTRLLEPAMFYPLPVNKTAALTHVPLTNREEAVEIVLIAADQLQQLITTHPTITPSIIQAVATTQARLFDEQVQYATSNLEQRLAALLLRLHRLAGNDIIHVGHASLAALLNVNRESVSLGIKSLRDIGHIRTAYRRVCLLDLIGLQLFAAGALDLARPTQPVTRSALQFAAVG